MQYLSNAMFSAEPIQEDNERWCVEILHNKTIVALVYGDTNFEAIGRAKAVTTVLTDKWSTIDIKKDSQLDWSMISNE